MVWIAVCRHRLECVATGVVVTVFLERFHRQTVSQLLFMRFIFIHTLSSYQIKAELFSLLALDEPHIRVRIIVILWQSELL